MIVRLLKKITIMLGIRDDTGGKNSASFISVGFKIMAGVGLISNICIGLLIYTNHKAFNAIEMQTDSLLEINAAMNNDLRDSIFALQQKYLQIPERLQSDTVQGIKNWISENYTIEKEEIVQGRENYKSLFNRSQRRDISKGNCVVQVDENRVILSRGQMDNEKNFLDAVDRIYLAVSNPESAAQEIVQYIQISVEAAGNKHVLAQKVLELKNRLADEAIHAEKARNAILYKTEEIENKKSDLARASSEKQNQIRLIAVVAILMNLLLLHVITWFVVEKPLKRLTASIDKINCGESSRIPYQRRKDAIGTLASTLVNFQGVLTRLKAEDRRKQEERQIIQALIKKMSGLIEHIQAKALTMKNNAVQLSALATATENQTETATQSASRTVEQTRTVSYATSQLQSAVKDISTQISKQNALVGDINMATEISSRDMDQLNQATEEINDIVNIVKHIAGETKLLALNARIEAARSGAAGKGFTVIAKEVSQLSVQTENANEDIAQKVASIQQASRTIIANTRKVETRITRLTAASQQISAAVTQQSITTQGISKNVHSAAADIKDVSSRIGKVKEAARETSRFAGDVASYSGQIESHLSALLLETRQQLYKIGAMDDGLAQPGQDTDPEENVCTSVSVTSLPPVQAGQHAA